MTTQIIHSNFGKSCSEKILIREIKEFFENSKKIKSLYYTRESYEGSEECPCGLRKEFDKDGKLMSEKNGWIVTVMILNVKRLFKTALIITY